MRRFTALYTHQKLKKAKTWQDGFAQYNSEAREIVLFDSSNGRIASYRLRARESIELSNEYDVGRFLLTLEEEQDVDVSAATIAVNDSNDLGNGCSTSKSNVENLRRPTKRTRRPASLIKPIKIKPTAAPGYDDTDEVAPTKTIPVAKAVVGSKFVEYTALYTTQKIKKLKAWSDGMLVFYPDDQRLILKDDDGSTLTSTHATKGMCVEAGSEIDCGRFLIQIECEKGSESQSFAGSNTVSNCLLLSGALKRRHETIIGEKFLQRSTAAVAAGKPKLTKLLKKSSSLGPSSNSDPEGTSTVPGAMRLPTRATFTPPEPQVLNYLHFPRRGELLQHVSVSKGYGMGPPRTLTAPVTYAEWTHYREKLSALLRDNLTVELSALAIRYFFMARERLEGRTKDAPVSRTQIKQRGRGRALDGLAQTCKSVGVLFFDGCTIRQPFMESAAFKAQLTKGSVKFSKGDSITIELSRREAYASYAKDDTWAISTSEDFSNDATFLARSVFFAPSKNNTLELVLVGEEDAQVASRIFNGESSKGANTQRTPKARYEKMTPTVVAIRCLDSASDWSMIDTVEELLSPETLPCLPHLLSVASLQLPSELLVPIDDLTKVISRADEIMDIHKRMLDLNDDQFIILRQVVLSALSIYIPIDDSVAVTVVHGPFGTGKSFLIAAITICLDRIAEEFPTVFGGSSTNISDLTECDIDSAEKILRARKRPIQPQLRVMLSSMTNFAVDNMLSALLKQDYDRFLRVGNLKRVSKSILPYVCRSSSSVTDDIKELESMLELARDETEQEAINTALQRFRQQSVQSTLDSTFVVGTTCLSAAAATLKNTQFPLVILDEACQIVEPMALIALANAGCQRLVLVGDPLQLPPTLTTRSTKAAEGRGLDRALFDRLVEMGHQPRFLSTQYRCHPHIGSLCNQLFYQGRLCHGISSDSRPPLLPGLPSLAFLDTAGQEKQQGRSQSFFNRGEIDMAVQLTCRLLMGGIQPESIGVIALYKTQVGMIQERLAAALSERCCVQVSTVDAYQGSERDIIIISCVRTEKIGFIANPNRVNVALSRARNHCFILGCRRLLETNSMWRNIIEYCRYDPTTSITSAQALINHVAAVVAQESASTMSTSGTHDTTTHILASSDEFVNDARQHMTETVMVADPIPAASEGSPGHVNAVEGCAIDDDEDEEAINSHPESCYDEGIVGGILSQWSLPGMEVEGSDDGGDILDCLDVDLDKM